MAVGRAGRALDSLAFGLLVGLGARSRLACVPAARASDRPSQAGRGFRRVAARRRARGNRRDDDAADRRGDPARPRLAGADAVADGSFGAGAYRGNIAVTSLAGLAFMASGSSPGRGPYGAQIDKALDYVMAKHLARGLHRRGRARPTGRCIPTGSAPCSWPKPTA